MSLKSQREAQLREAIRTATASIAAAKARIEEYNAELTRMNGVPDDFGQQNMVDPRDVDIYLTGCSSDAIN